MILFDYLLHVEDAISSSLLLHAATVESSEMSPAVLQDL
jgi:hypothetical protein